MRIRTTIWRMLIIAVAIGCGGSSGIGGVGDDADVTRTATDPTGDTFGGSPSPWDVTALTLERGADGIDALLDFSRDVVAPMNNDTSAVIAFLDLDLDQQPSTGAGSTVDEFRSDGRSTGLGVDATVNFNDLADDGTVAVVDAQGRTLGRVKPTFEGRRIRVHLPSSVLANDDGFLNAAAIVGRRSRPSDIVPNDGHLSLAR